MALTSIIVVSNKERWLDKTIEDIRKNARGDYEIVVGLDGYWPDPPLPFIPNLSVVHTGVVRGMRHMINSAAAIARGDFLLKCDGHCGFSEGFDLDLQKDYPPDSIVVARRYSMDLDAWMENRDPRQHNKGAYDYHYLDCPMTHLPEEYFQFHGVIWKDRNRDPRYLEKTIDETMSWQGSMWFMSRKHFHENLRGMSEYGYGTFSQEPQEIGLKTQLGFGGLWVNKNPWYVHLHKGSLGRGYNLDWNQVKEGHKYSADYWMRNLWDKRQHDIEWLIKKFEPLPKWQPGNKDWPEDWEKRLNEWRENTPPYQAVNV